MESADAVIFYRIEKAIKSYRQLAQKRLKAAGLRITVDQWLTLSSLSESPGLSQKSLAAMVFKDEASITRMVNLLVKAGYLRRVPHNDQRRSVLRITAAGKALLVRARRVVRGYREEALRGIGRKEIDKADKVMKAIITNCKP